MKLQDFESELQKDVHADFSIKLSPTPGLAAVYFRGVFQFGVPADQIHEEAMQFYGIELPNGKYIRHRTRPEALAMAKELIRKMHNDHEEYEASMGLGKYSAEELAKR